VVKTSNVWLSATTYALSCSKAELFFPISNRSFGVLAAQRTSIVGTGSDNRSRLGAFVSLNRLYDASSTKIRNKMVVTANLG
jgi:hypothetical protein